MSKKSYGKNKGFIETLLPKRGRSTEEYERKYSDRTKYSTSTLKTKEATARSRRARNAGQFVAEGAISVVDHFHAAATTADLATTPLSRVGHAADDAGTDGSLFDAAANTLRYNRKTRALDNVLNNRRGERERESAKTADSLFEGMANGAARPVTSKMNMAKKVVDYDKYALDVRIPHI